LIDTLIKWKLIIVIKNTEYESIFINIKKKVTLENSKDCEYCIKVALNHAKKRINFVKNSDKKCLLEEYREWIIDGLNMHTVLLLREDPIIWNLWEILFNCLYS